MQDVILVHRHLGVCMFSTDSCMYTADQGKFVCLIRSKVKFFISQISMFLWSWWISMMLGYSWCALMTLHNHDHYSDVIMSTMLSQITSLTIVYSTVYLGADERKHQSSALLAFVQGIHRWPVNSPHKWPVTWKMFPFDDVIMMVVDALRPMGATPSAATQRIFFNWKFFILIQISLKYVPKGPINNNPALVQIMAWHRPGAKPLSEPMMVRLPMHICIPLHHWVKQTKRGMGT